jgi:hypothetical protein
MAAAPDFEPPDIFEMMIEGVRRIDKAHAEMVVAQQAFQEAVDKYNEAKAAVRELGEMAGLVVKQQANPRNEGINYLKDASMAVRWRIAFYLLVHPKLDYQYAAEQLWGPGLDPKVAKNRVNAHVTALKRDGVAVAVGRATYKIVPHRLHELSKLPLPERADTKES